MKNEVGECLKNSGEILSDGGSGKRVYAQQVALEWDFEEFRGGFVNHVSGPEPSKNVFLLIEDISSVDHELKKTFSKSVYDGTFQTFPYTHETLIKSNKDFHAKIPIH